MNTVRVNLLRPAECRYQGVVSKEFAVRVGAWGGGALVAVMLLTGVVNHRSMKHELATSRDSWVAMEPRYERVSAMQAELGQQRQVQRELDAWQQARVPWHEVLLDLQRLVPADVQLTMLHVKSEFTLLPDPKAEKKEAGGLPARKFQLSLDGRTSGEMADETVVRFLAAIREQSMFAEKLESIKLQGLQRAAKHQGDDSQRTFGIEGITHAKEL